MVVNLPKLHRGQKRIWDEIEQANAKYNIIRCSRQFGKSNMLYNLIIYYSVKYPTFTLSDIETGFSVEKTCENMYTAQTYALARTAFKRILKMLKQFNYVEESNKSELEITLKNGVIIYFKGAERHENIKGNSISYLFCDEFALYDDLAWDESLGPMVSTTGQKIFFVSTPKGKFNKFFQFDMMGQSGNPNYCSTFATYKENPFRDQEIIDMAEITTAPQLFLQEFGGQYIDGVGSVFHNFQECAILTSFSEPEPNVRYVIGIDWGQANDSTVMTVMNEHRKTMFIFSVMGTDYVSIGNQLATYIKKYNPIIVLAENNGNGKPAIDILRSTGVNVTEWTATSSTKQIMIGELIKAFNLKTISIPTEKFYKPLFDELSAFKLTQSTSGNVSYGAISGMHDDHCISLGLANLAISQYMSSSTEPYAFKPFSNSNRW